MPWLRAARRISDGSTASRLSVPDKAGLKQGMRCKVLVSSACDDVDRHEMALQYPLEKGNKENRIRSLSQHTDSQSKASSSGRVGWLMALVRVQNSNLASTPRSQALKDVSCVEQREASALCPASTSLGVQSKALVRHEAGRRVPFSSGNFAAHGP